MVSKMDFKCLEPTDKIERVNFSVRTFNALSQAGITTLADLVLWDEKALRKINNLGQKSLGEIKKFLSKLTQDAYMREKFMLQDEVIIKTFYDSEGIERKDIKLIDVGFSVRSYNGLDRAGYTYLSQLLYLKRDDLLEIKNLGQNSINEILEKIVNIEIEEILDISLEENIDCRKFSEKASDILNIDSKRLYYELHPVFENAKNEQRDVKGQELLTSPFFRGLMKQKIVDFLNPFDFGVEFSEILKLFPFAFVEQDIVFSLLEELEVEEDIVIDGKIRLKYMTILKYADSLKKEQWREFIKWRLEGFTLDIIGQEKGLTRERVRQIVDKVLNKRPRLFEDRYIEFFEAYNFSMEEFCYIFTEEEIIYNYLTLVAKRRGERRLDELMYDESLPTAIRKRAQQIVYKDYVNIDGEWIYKHRFEFIDYVVRTYFQEESSFDQFVYKYYELLKELGFSENENLILKNVRSYENKFNRTYDKVLWKAGRKFRYYDIGNYDFSEFWHELELQQYKNVEYSASKFLNEHLELMNKYDIRDEYELHNLLRKLCEKEKNEGITFGRMPMITFGEANRDEQVLDMLLQVAPVSIQDLAVFYEMEYGVLAKTFMSNHLQNFSEYFSDGIYCISVDPLPFDQLNCMKEILVNDFYLTTDIKQIYQEEFPLEPVDNINSYTLKTLGFNVFTGYVIKNTYDTAVAYVTKLLTEEDFVDIRELPTGLTGKVSYSSQLYKLRNSYEIIEYKLNHYMNIRYLDRLGVTKEALQDYCQAVFNFINTEELFTIKLLRNKGFSHVLDRLGFTETFYESLLTGDHSSFSYQRMGGVRLFCKKGEKVLLANFLQKYVEKHGVMEVSKLLYHLLSHYGMDFTHYKLLEVIGNSSMYYEPIEKNVYPNYETYLHMSSN